MTRFFYIAALFLISLSLSLSVAEAHPSPKPWVKTLIERAQKLADIEMKGTAEKKNEQWEKDVQKLITDALDWPALTERSLGQQWKTLNESQRKEFSVILKKMIEASYESKLRMAKQEKGKRPENVGIHFKDESQDKDEAKINAEVTADKKKLFFGFDLIWRGKGWKIWDVSVDEVSTVRTYRAQFRKIIREEGFPALIKRMKQKTDDIQAGRADVMQ